jgi:hypothetical protein
MFSNLPGAVLFGPIAEPTFPFTVFLIETLKILNGINDRLPWMIPFATDAQLRVLPPESVVDMFFVTRTARGDIQNTKAVWIPALYITDTLTWPLCVANFNGADPIHLDKVQKPRIPVTPNS